MCSSTPADFRHFHFESPGRCEHWVRLFFLVISPFLFGSSSFCMLIFQPMLTSRSL
ncbi:hypothetical protein B0H17DRAFT_1034208 [Mycena rosella]|uniref:Uncharacterized protein n=1 Tax=Mycena rosella TaxID=1033263 RepID=A0AAD7M995_MYCRO|nr:hypothetical protein B0H17DRAFT_1034208 [Mycena rosella]